MKTILHTIDTTGPGGAETVFIDIASRLPAERYRSIVCIRGKGWVYDELKRRGFDPVIIEAQGSFNLRYLRALIRLIREESVDLVQSHLLGTNVYCSMAGWLTGTPVITTFHGQVDIGVNERFKSLKSAVINRGACAIVAVSAGLKQDILQLTTLRQDRTVVVYNGIDTAEFKQHHDATLRQQFGWGEQDVIVGCLGNIRPAKGYDILLHAANRLLDAETPGGGRYRFAIAGQGRKDLSVSLQAYSDEHGLGDSVKFLGFCDDASGFLSGLDLFCLPSTSEGFSIATIQGMAAGLPVVVTRSGGPQEIVTHGETGYMVEPGDAGAIADALQLVVTDAALSRRIAEQGQCHAIETFDIQSMLDGYINLYQKYAG